MRLALGHYGQLDRFAAASPNAGRVDSGLSRSLVEKINSGHRPMTASVAAKLEAIYGISAEWLMTGSAESAPVTSSGRPFGRESFKRHQQRLLAGSDERNTLAVYPAGFLPELMGTAVAAMVAGRLASFLIDLEDAVKRLRKRYGFNRPTFDATLASMGVNAPAFFMEVTDDVESTEEERKFRRVAFVHMLKSGGVMTQRRDETRLVDTQEYYAANPEMVPGAKTEWEETAERPDGKKTVVRMRRVLAKEKKSKACTTQQRASAPRSPARKRAAR